MSRTFALAFVFGIVASLTFHNLQRLSEKERETKSIRQGLADHVQRLLENKRSLEGPA